MLIADIFSFLNLLKLKNVYSFDLIICSHFYFLFSISRESIIFGSKFSKWRFWWIYTFWGLLNPKIIFLANGLCVCVSVCVCYQHNSKTNHSRNIKFGIQHLYHVQMLLETFYKHQTKTLCIGTLKRILIHYGLWSQFLVCEFSYI